MTFARYVYPLLDYIEWKTETVFILVTPPCLMGHAEKKKKDKTVTKKPNLNQKKEKKKENSTSVESSLKEEPMK